MGKVGTLGCVLLAAGCASTNQSSPIGGGGGNAICPNHPEQCGGMCCGDKCVDTMFDPFNCGSCTNQCTNGELCKGGACGCLPSGTRCGSGQSCCSSAGCKSLDSDAFNCGKCGNACQGGQVCTNGTCACPAGGCVPLDMSLSMPPDMSVGSSSGACQCSNHCANDPFVHWCVGDQCCYIDGLFGRCNIGPCQINTNP
jgi:hypothetical protein